MLWKLQICSVKRTNYRKRNIFRALETADMLLRSARTMENVSYFILWELQICSVERPNYGKRNIRHALEATDMLCEEPELWKTYHISRVGGRR